MVKLSIVNCDLINHFLSTLLTQVTPTEGDLAKYSPTATSEEEVVFFPQEAANRETNIFFSSPILQRG